MMMKSIEKHQRKMSSAIACLLSIPQRLSEEGEESYIGRAGELYWCRGEPILLRMMTYIAHGTKQYSFAQRAI